MARLGHSHGAFSENELIHDYFDGRSAGTMVDVGAHFGESFADYLEAGWAVLAFEPDGRNRVHLARFLNMRGFRLREEAVSDKSLPSVPFFASDESSGISSLLAFRPTHHELTKVAVTTLRNALAEDAIKDVSFLKIDAEGHDLLVLKGFPWDQDQPEVILCEFEDSKTLSLGYDYRTLGDFLLGKGYDVFVSEWFPIVQYGIRHRWRRWARYPVRLEDASAWGNFVAFRAGCDLARIEAYLTEQAEANHLVGMTRRALSSEPMR
jgi:FkbM family methyltransferase